EKLDREDRDGESCGTDSVPYLIEIDREGKPELFCDVPVCLEPHLRRSKRSSKEQKHDDPVCNHKLLETVCAGTNEWTSGLKEINNGTHRTLKTECCSYDGLVGAKELKTVLLEAGDRFQGGPVKNHGRERAYDLIKEVRKTVTSENHVQYVISVYRMPCSSSSSSKEHEDSSRSPRSSSHNYRRSERRGVAYDDFEYAPRGRKFLDDYDLPPRVLRRMQRRRMMRRRPILDEYYDYDMDYVLPLRPLQRRKGGRQAQAAPNAAALALDDRLWPVSYDGQQLASNKPSGAYDSDALPEVTVNNDPGIKTQAMPLPPMPSVVDGMQMQMQTLSALPASYGAGATAAPPAGPLPPPSSSSYQVVAAPAESVAQAPYYGAPA
ncbi:hypothetical protein PMAYCL1PPCAC_30647, partial [Pristionchus mayeri]